MISKKILVVDDLMPLRKIIKGHLQKIGFQAEMVLEAENGKKALDLISSNPDIVYVITDWNMPELDGVEMIKRIRSGELLPSHVGIAVISGQDEHSSVLEALSAGATEFIRKPISLSSIKDLLENSGII